MDSHADVSCAGMDALVTSRLEGRTCDVKGFHDSYGPISNVSYVNVMYKYGDEKGQEYLLELNQALDFTETMRHSILCTNQARHNGVIVNDIPRIIDRSSPQCITFPSHNINLPLSMKGPVPVLNVSKPRVEDLTLLPKLQLTSEDTPWLPHAIFGDGFEDGHTYHECDDDYYISGLMEMHKIIEHHKINSIRNTNKGGKCSADHLSKLWGIGIKAAERTIDSTTQLSRRDIMGNISRRVRTKVHQRRYRQLDGYLGRFSSDTFFSKCKSLRGNNCFQLFTNRASFTKAYPMETKGDAGFALNRFIDEVDVPTEIHTDGSKEQSHGRWKKTCQKHSIYRTWSEPYSPWQNLAEKAGGIIKSRCRDMMRRTNTPVVLWDYCVEYNSDLRSMTATNSIDLAGRTPHEKIMGYTPDISELVEFEWYQWIWYNDPVSQDRTRLGRWLGPAHNAGQGLAYYILTGNGEVVMRSTVVPLAETEITQSTIKERQEEFTKDIGNAIGNYNKAAAELAIHKPTDEADIYNDILFDADDHSEDLLVQEIDPDDIPVVMPYHDNIKGLDAPSAILNDSLLGAEVTLPSPQGLINGKVKRRKVDQSTNLLVGTHNDNPILDSRVYEVEMPDGTYNDYSANVLIENIMASVDDQGQTPMMLEDIIGHRFNNDYINENDGWYITPQGSKKRRITTRGCDLNVQWTDGTSSWIPLKDMKESNPLEVSDYAIRNSIGHHPVFAWWVPQTIKRKERIVKQISHRLAKKQFKFGIKVPNSVNEALSLDKENNNTLWHEAIQKELKNVLVAFRLVEEGEHLPVGSKQIPYHIIFDVKLDLTRKARLVAGGHRNKDVPKYTTFSTVASRDSVRIMFLIAALNGLKVLSTDVGNAYLNAECREKVHVKCGKELFGPEHEGKYAVIARALYGLKSSGASWRHHFATEIRSMGFKGTKADDDV